MITLVVAYNSNYVIGDASGKIPWHLPEDLKFFKKTTMGKPCIMGRTTWDSLPEQYKPLSGRKNIVVTRKPDVFFQFNTQHVFLTDNPIYFCSSVEKALENARTYHEEVCIIGGGEIYRYCLEHNLVDRVLASEIKGFHDVEGKTYFPKLNESDWTRSKIQDFADFSVYEYKCLNRQPPSVTVQT